MNKRPDFASDLQELRLDVHENVASILTAARDRSPATGETQSKTPAPEESSLPTKPKPKPRSHAPRATAKLPEASERRPLQNVSTKLPPETKELLRQAAHFQAAKRLTPDTEQGIINHALCDWFKRHGYSRRLTAVDSSPGETADAAEEPASSE